MICFKISVFIFIYCKNTFLNSKKIKNHNFKTLTDYFSMFSNYFTHRYMKTYTETIWPQFFIWQKWKYRCNFEFLALNIFCKIRGKIFQKYFKLDLNDFLIYMCYWEKEIWNPTDPKPRVYTLKENSSFSPETEGLPCENHACILFYHACIAFLLFKIHLIGSNEEEWDRGKFKNLYSTSS